MRRRQRRRGAKNSLASSPPALVVSTHCAPARAHLARSRQEPARGPFKLPFAARSALRRPFTRPSFARFPPSRESPRQHHVTTPKLSRTAIRRGPERFERRRTSLCRSLLALREKRSSKLFLNARQTWVRPAKEPLVRRFCPPLRLLLHGTMRRRTFY